GTAPCSSWPRRWAIRITIIGSPSLRPLREGGSSWPRPPGSPSASWPGRRRSARPWPNRAGRGGENRFGNGRLRNGNVLSGLLGQKGNVHMVRLVPAGHMVHIHLLAIDEGGGIEP